MILLFLCSSCVCVSQSLCRDRAAVCCSGSLHPEEPLTCMFSKSLVSGTLLFPSLLLEVCVKHICSKVEYFGYELSLLFFPILAKDVFLSSPFSCN